MLRKVVVKMKGSKGRYIRYFEPCQASECTICKSLIDIFARFLDNPDVFRPVKGLAQHNYNRHLDSRKHWKLVEEKVD